MACQTELCFLAGLGSAWEFIGQNRLADVDNTEAQRELCLTSHILRFNHEQQLVRAMHKHYLPTTTSKYPAILVAMTVTNKPKTPLIIHHGQESVFLCSQEMS